MKWSGPLGVSMCLLTAVATVGGEVTDPAAELEVAKALYRDARFAEAAAQLHEIAVALKPQVHVPGARDLLIETYLHSALCHVAVDSPIAAKQAFKDMLALDPGRRLDPAVYAPKVVEIFSGARDDMPTPVGGGEAPGAEINASEAGGSKALPILLGAGAAAGVAVAVGGGGDSATTSPTQASTPTTTATPVPATNNPIVDPGDVPLSGEADVALVSWSPPAGSTISVSGGPELVLTIRYQVPGDESTCMTIGPAVVVGARYCGPGGNFIVPGGNQIVEFNLGHSAGFSSAACTPPLETTAIQIAIARGSDCDFDGALVDKHFAIRYSWVE